MRFLKPAEITTLFLFFLYLLAILLKDSTAFFTAELVRFSLITLSFVVPTFFVLKLQQQKIHWDNVLITLLILLLLADTALPPLLAVALGLTTFLFKIFIRIQKHPIFNPAAISLVVLYFFGLTTTWWGVSFSPRFTDLGISSAMLFTLPLGLYIIAKYQKVPTLVATVLGMVGLSLILQATVPYKLLIEGTFAFFLLIMATEPKTTPVIDKQEWVYGLLLGTSLAAWFYFKLPLPYLLNLLILNALFTVFKLLQLKMATRAHSV